MSKIMKTLTINETTYEIIDKEARDKLIDVDSDIADLDTRVTALENGSSDGDGLTQTEKDLILTLFSKAAYAEDDAGDAYTALSRLWAGYSVTWSGTGYSKSNKATSVKDGATFTSTVSAHTGFTISSVTATMGGVTVQGAWSNGTVTIPNVTGDIVITVTTAQMTVSSISAVYTQSRTVYDTDSLDSLKSDLVVTAAFMDSSTGVISADDYTLSGTLDIGTSTITVEYNSKTTTFDVVVSAYVPTPVYELPSATVFDGTNYIDSGVKLLATDHDYTICFDVTDSYGTGGSSYWVFDGSHNANMGFSFVMWRSNYWTSFTLINASNIVNTASANRMKVVLTHAKGEDSVNVYWVKNNETTKNTNTVTYNGITTNQHYISSTQTIIVGAKYDGTNIAHCTMHDFKIYDSDVLDESVINAYLGVS